MQLLGVPMKKYAIIIIFLSTISSKAIAQENKTNQTTEMTVSSDTYSVSALVADDASKEVYELMNKATNSVGEGDLNTALEKYINPIIKVFEQEYKNKYTLMYSARSSQESIIYSLEMLVVHGIPIDKKKLSNVYRIPYVFAKAFYAKGSVNISLGRINLGRKALEKAITLAPRNSLFLSELGYTYQVDEKFTEAMEIYEKALSGAEHSPDTEKKREKGRALRGIGYSLIELNRLDEAEEKYQQALAINPSDGKSLNELKYIKNLRQKNVGNK